MLTWKQKLLYYVPRFLAAVPIYCIGYAVYCLGILFGWLREPFFEGMNNSQEYGQKFCDWLDKAEVVAKKLDRE